MPCTSNLKGWVGANGGIVFNKHKSPTKIEMQVPCGQCWSCRLARSREWAARLVKEAKYWPEDKLVFLTLTYNELHLPAKQSLDLKHFQNFMKALRYARSTKIGDGKRKYPKIKFFHCGEYGQSCKTCGQSLLNHEESRSSKPKTGCPKFIKGLGRPHYHAIIYGVNFPDMEIFKRTKAGEIIYQSEELNELWGKGFCSIGKVTFESCAYVARYIMKKINGDEAEDHYNKIIIDKDTGQITSSQVKPEYITMSRKPAIAKEYIDENMEDITKHDAMLMQRKDKALLMGIPRYFDKQIEKTSPETMEKIKEKRRQKRRRNLENHKPERAEANQKITAQKMREINRDYEEYSENDN